VDWNDLCHGGADMLLPGELSDEDLWSILELLRIHILLHRLSINAPDEIE
jgi:hypothetical protein